MDPEAPEPWSYAALWPSLSIRAIGFETDKDEDGGATTTHFLLELRSREATWSISRTFAEVRALHRAIGADQLGIELPGSNDSGIFGDWELVSPDPDERMRELEGFLMALMRSPAASGAAPPSTLGP